MLAGLNSLREKTEFKGNGTSEVNCAVEICICWCLRVR